jgi:hypothetical protein
MLGIPRDQMVLFRDQAISALNAVMISGSSYEITHEDGSRQRVTRANITEIMNVIHLWSAQIS